MNRTIVLKRISGLVIGLLVGVLVACGGSSVASSGSSGLTQADVQQMITAAVAPLNQQIAALQTQVAQLSAAQPQKAAVFIRAPNAVLASARSTRAITRALPSPCNWTLTGRPQTSDPISDNLYAGVSCTGYYFLITAAATGGTAGIQPSSALMVGWDGPGCTGNAYVINGVSTGAAVNGFVFVANTTQPGFFGPDANPADYYYVAAGSARAMGVTLASIWTGAQPGVCQPGGIVADGYPALANDESITGVPSVPVPGPVLISD